MSNIKVLDELTIDKIAAGEVIERPASVVKELVENAIDSQANAITIEIKNGGSSFIRITDNGCGIHADEVPTAFLRHATSKISNALDLLSIHSLGFRGEALSSISAVAQVELITKTASALTGVRYQIAGGKEISIEHIGCPEGTTFIVRNLFFNVPARQKFLKTPQTEGAHIYDLVQQLALSHPEISFQFIMNGQNRFHTSGNGNIKDIIYTIYGRDVANALLPVSFSNNELGIQVSGFIGKPIISRGNRSFENYYINQRYVKSKVIYRAIEEAYKTFTMVHKFPFVCLAFEMEPEQLDVNVHPTKMDIRFHQEQQLFYCLKQEIKHVLLTQNLIPDVSLSNDKKTQPVKTKQHGVQPFEKIRRKQEEIILTQHTVAETPNTTTATSNFFSQRNETTALQKTSAIPQTLTINYTAGSKEVKKQTSAYNNATKNTEQAVPLDNHDVANNQQTVPPTNHDTANTQHTAPQANHDTAELENQKTTKLEQTKEHFDSKEQPINFSKKSNDLPDVFEQITEKKAPAKQLSFLDNSVLEEELRPNYRIIGQLFKTYWLIEFDKKLLVMDQHAAHEKVNYERFMKHRKDKKNVYVQQVSPAIVVTLSPKEAIVYEEYKEFFADFGFEIESYGGVEYCIRGVPTDLYGIADKDAFVGLLDEICENVHGTDVDLIADKIATMACKASVKGNQKLSYEEAQALIDELMTLDSPFTCPHGRPTIISMTQTEIEKKFKRIQN